MNQNAITQAMIRQIVAHARCAVCGHHFSKSDIQIIGRRENAWAMSVTCRECRTKALMLAVMANGVTQPIYTDLDPVEWERFKARPPISENDVINFYAWLSAYEGDFSEVLDEPLADE
jgi:hypothetical protein